MSGDARWSAALRHALAMGIVPEAFWRLSVKEWRMLTGAEAGLRRDELAALMARFPDGVRDR